MSASPSAQLNVRFPTVRKADDSEAGSPIPINSDDDSGDCTNGGGMKGTDRDSRAEVRADGFVYDRVELPAEVRRGGRFQELDTLGVKQANPTIGNKVIVRKPDFSNMRKAAAVMVYQRGEGQRIVLAVPHFTSRGDARESS